MGFSLSTKDYPLYLYQVSLKAQLTTLQPADRETSTLPSGLGDNSCNDDLVFEQASHCRKPGARAAVRDHPALVGVS